MSSRVMRLRRDDVCCRCGRRIAKGAEGYWDARARTVTCVGCAASHRAAARTPRQAQSIDLDEASGAAPLDRGSPGASARREHERRRRNREARTRARHRWIGAAILALSSPPQHERAWDAGARGEEAVGRSLERRTAKGPALIMHDRQMPKGRGNIDHLAVAPGGVFVIDAKAIKGSARISQPLFGKPKLIIAERDRTRLVDGLDRQVDAVRGALERGYGEVPVVGIFCFTEVHLPWFGRTIRGHRLRYCRDTARQLNRSGPLRQDAIDSIARSLEVAFPSAADASRRAR
jgi:hypothetical protein